MFLGTKAGISALWQAIFDQDCVRLQQFLFINKKARRLYHQRKRPAKIAWTTVYRKQHRKVSFVLAGIVAAVGSAQQALPSAMQCNDATLAVQLWKQNRSH